MKQHTKTAHSPLHIQEMAHSRKKSTRIILKFFVWILIFSFVATIGVSWGEGGGSYGNIVSTKGTKIDLSPAGFFMRERESVYQNITEQYSNQDPRLVNEYVNTLALRQTEALALRSDFLKEARIVPSAEMTETIRRNSGIGSTEMIRYYYGAQELSPQMIPLGVLGILGEPTISDIYAFNSLSRLQIAAEGIAFNITNYYAAQVPLEEKEAFYQQNAERWADRVVAASFSTDSRSNAFALINIITNAPTLDDGIADAKAALEAKGRWTNTSFNNSTIYLPSIQYDLFRAGVAAFKKRGAKEYAVSSPVYQNGRYTILLATSIGSYAALNSFEQNNLDSEYVRLNYKALNRSHRSSFDKALALIKTRLAENISFSELSTEEPSVQQDSSQLFNPLSGNIASVQGGSFAVPVLQNPPLMKALLLGDNQPQIFADPLKKDTYYAVRTLALQSPRPEDLEIDLANIGQDSAYLQTIYSYRTAMLDQGLTYGRRKLYGLKSNEALLTNFNNSSAE